MSQHAPRMSAALAVPEFRALWLAEAQSIFGDQLAKVALTILVYDRTGSAFWAAIVYALTFLSALVGGLGLAQLADRFPRRRLMVAGTAVQAGLVGVMAIPGMPIQVLGGLVFAVGLVQSLTNAAQNAVTREVFTDDALYMRSQDLRGITTNTLMLLGLAGGGLVVVAIGTSWALAIDAVTFAVSAVLLRALVKDRPAAGRRDAAWLGAARWVFGQHRVRVLITFGWLVGFVVVPEGLAAPLAEDIGAGSETVGWLLAADPLGFVAGTFLLSRFVASEIRVRFVGFLGIGSAGVLIAFLAQPALPLALLLLALAGALGAYQITVNATFTTWTPNEIRAGAGGIYRTGLRVAQGVGVAGGGAVAELWGSTTNTIALFGALGVAVAIPATVSWLRLRPHTPADPTGAGR